MSDSDDDSSPARRCRQTDWRREGSRKRKYLLSEDDSEEEKGEPGPSENLLMNDGEGANSQLNSDESLQNSQGVDSVLNQSACSESQQAVDDQPSTSDSDWSEVLENHAVEDGSEVDEAGSEDNDDANPPPVDRLRSLSDTDESDSDNNFNFDHHSLDAILEFKQAKTAKESLLLDLALFVRHQQTFECLIQSLVRKNILLGAKYFPSSKKELWRILGRNGAGIKAHVYCSKCDAYLGEKKVLGEFVVCDCGVTHRTKDASIFLSISVKKQLEHFLSTPGIAELLKYRETRIKKKEGDLEDIFDGCEYQKLMSNSSQNFSYVFNTDGCKISFKAKTSIYPLFLRLNELPPQLRQKFMFLAGIFVDTKEPNMMSFLKPFVSQMNLLSSRGILWKPDGINWVTSKFLPTCFCVDGKARSQILNMNSHAGYFGCTYCTYSGVSINGTMRYPIQHPGLSEYHMRTDEGMKADMITAHETNTVVRGHKGPTPLMLMNHLDLAKGAASDDLHNFYECAARQHTELLMTNVRRVDMNMGDNRLFELLDSRLRAIKTPSCISRKPGTCSMKNRNQFKGTEWRNWLLFYAVPCLQNLIPDLHIRHLERLSLATYLLSQDIVSNEQIDTAEKYITQYLELYEEHFGVESTRLNLHALGHAPQSVRNWGPLWCYTTFNFESWNHDMIQKVSSATGVLQQIVTRHLIHMNLEMAMLSDREISMDVKDHLGKILGKKRHLYAQKLSDHSYVLGNPVQRPPTEEESLVLRRENLQTENLSVYQKILIRSIEYRPTNVQNVNSKSDNSTVYTYGNTFCTIESIVTFQNVDGLEVCGMFVKEHEVIHPPPFKFATHISMVKADAHLFHFIRSEEVRVPVVKVPVLQNLYLVPVPNPYQID